MDLQPLLIPEEGAGQISDAERAKMAVDEFISGAGSGPLPLTRLQAQAASAEGAAAGINALGSENPSANSVIQAAASGAASGLSAAVMLSQEVHRGVSLQIDSVVFAAALLGSRMISIPNNKPAVNKWSSHLAPLLAACLTLSAGLYIHLHGSTPSGAAVLAVCIALLALIVSLMIGILAGPFPELENVSRHCTFVAFFMIIALITIGWFTILPLWCCVVCGVFAIIAGIILMVAWIKSGWR